MPELLSPLLGRHRGTAGEWSTLLSGDLNLPLALNATKRLGSGHPTICPDVRSAEFGFGRRMAGLCFALAAGDPADHFPVEYALERT
jgi:hypothetical protein